MKIKWHKWQLQLFYWEYDQSRLEKVSDYSFTADNELYLIGYINAMKRHFSIAFFLMITFIDQNAIATPKYNDIRVVIDVSGSMKKTDPLNLRIPAMKILNGLIPAGSYAGVWNFGRDVNMTVKWGKVDNAWRKQADMGATKIHSNGLFTDIESALARATLGWEAADPKAQRSIILLTDGQVDISKNEVKNKASRNTVLTQSIQALKESDVKVHAIALSKDADKTLLKQLALETGGSFETAESAKELQKLFLKLFERATAPDMIELVGNEFTIDKSVKEMTLLIFRPKKSKETQLYPPGTEVISSKRKGKSTWRSDEGYDLITIKKPKVGVWKIDAYSDPDNRLMVVTDLKLKVNEVPAYMTPSESLSIVAELHNKGKKISKNSLLRFVEFNLTHIDENGTENELSLIHRDVVEDKGQYRHLLEGSMAEGKHSFIVTIDSQTFNRSKRIDVVVQWPAKVEIKPTSEPGTYRLTIQAREEYLKPDTLHPNVQIKTPNGEQLDLKLNNIAGVWQADFNTNQTGLYQALIAISAQEVNGEKVMYDLGAFSMAGVYKTPVIEIEPELESALTDTADFEPIEEEVPIPDEETNLTQGMIILGAFNLVLILTIGGIFLMFRRSSRKSSFPLGEELADEANTIEEETFNV
ncbi:MAG: hypothetical protein ACI8XX_001154 [Polaribacter sp.]|jgi:uncharacterized protein (TIGR03503 family)